MIDAAFFQDDAPEDYKLELEVFYAANDASVPKKYQETIRKLWKAYCEMEKKAKADA